MPPRGYRDERKALLREFADAHPEQTARANAAYGLERDLRHLVRIAVLMDRKGITAWAAAGEIANEIGADDPRARHAIQKRLHRKFQQAPALYHRLAAAPEHPESAAEREISQELRVRPIADWERQYKERLIAQLYWARIRRKG
jgi:hypothetical protein